MITISFVETAQNKTRNGKKAFGCEKRLVSSNYPNSNAKHAAPNAIERSDPHFTVGADSERFGGEEKVK